MPPRDNDASFVAVQYRAPSTSWADHGWAQTSHDCSVVSVGVGGSELVISPVLTCGSGGSSVRRGQEERDRIVVVREALVPRLRLAGEGADLDGVEVRAGAVVLHPGRGCCRAGDGWCSCHDLVPGIRSSCWPGWRAGPRAGVGLAQHMGVRGREAAGIRPRHTGHRGRRLSNDDGVPSPEVRASARSP